MDKQCYHRGTAMTFPLELTEAKEISYEMDDKYLYPREVMEIQSEIEDVCNRIEGDGSIMYDEFPDKVTIERMAHAIKDGYACEGKDRDCWLQPLIQIMLCKEINFRRERRRKHKAFIKNRYS